MKKRMIARHWRLLSVAVACLALGAGASAIASAGADPAKPSASSDQHGAAQIHRVGHRGRLLRRAVAGEIVVRTKDGFGTVSLERGTIDEISGSRLTIAEGTRRASYRSVTVTIPADARIRDDGIRTGLSSVKAGERVLVITAPQRTFVIARTPKAA